MADKIAFSNELFRTFAEGMSEGMDVLDYYNAATAEREGAEYTEDFTGAVVDPGKSAESSRLAGFPPLMVPILDLQLLMELSTRLLMFSYIFIICIAAVGVIGYTRSQSVGLTNRQVFEDIRRLGADRHYRLVLMRRAAPQGICAADHPRRRSLSPVPAADALEQRQADQRRGDQIPAYHRSHRRCGGNLPVRGIQIICGKNKKASETVRNFMYGIIIRKGKP